MGDVTILQTAPHGNERTMPFATCYMHLDDVQTYSLTFLLFSSPSVTRAITFRTLALDDYLTCFGDSSFPPYSRPELVLTVLIYGKGIQDVHGDYGTQPGCRIATEFTPWVESLVLARLH